MGAPKRALTIVLSAGLTFSIVLTAPASAKTKDGCKALTTEEINAGFSEIAGGEAAEGAPTKFKGYTSCSWTFPDGAILFLGVDKLGTAAKKSFHERASAPDAEKVRGVKKAFFEPVDEAQGGGGGTVTFIDGTTIANLQYFTKTAVDDLTAIRDQLTTLAKQATKSL